MMTEKILNFSYLLNIIFKILIILIFNCNKYVLPTNFYYGINNSPLNFYGPKLFYCNPTTTTIIPTNYYRIMPTFYHSNYNPFIYKTISKSLYWYPIYRPASYIWKFRTKNGTNATDYIYKSRWYSPFWKYQGSIQHFPKEKEESESTKEKREDQLERESIVDDQKSAIKENNQEKLNEKIKNNSKIKIKTKKPEKITRRSNQKRKRSSSRKHDP